MALERWKGEAWGKAAESPSLSNLKAWWLPEILMDSELGGGWGMSTHPALLSHWPPALLCWCPLPCSNSAHSPTLTGPSLALSSPHSSSCISLEAGITAVLSACFWLTAWFHLQVSARYCLKTQPLAPWPSHTMWAIRVLPEGHPSLLASSNQGKGRDPTLSCPRKKVCICSVGH